MNEDEARDLRQRRQAEQPAYRWVVQQRGDTGEWIVARLPGVGRVDKASVEAHKGEPLDVQDDPRPSSMRNIPPYGPGF
ncbi:MAG: hypothetical protein DLM61_25555 [Pseudonocardiales bacterium]|nr:MAG: hypothetical protein DLM61_25555 [Pseudonocardiales bacterium]